MEYQNEKVIKTSIALAPHIIKSIDDYAAKMGISRSAAISILTEQALTYQQSLETVAAFTENLKQFGDLKKALGGLKLDNDKK